MVSDPSQGAIIQSAGITDQFEITVYGPNGRPLNPDRDLNGASRRALTLAFILALTRVSGVEAPNVIDTPLGMMSGYVKTSVLTTAIRESSQLVLFLTRSEIADCEDILDIEAANVITLTNPAHYPVMLANDPEVIQRTFCAATATIAKNAQSVRGRRFWEPNSRQRYRRLPVMQRYFNHFASINLIYPVEQREYYETYCAPNPNSTTDRKPFPRMVDFWFAWGMSLAAGKKLTPVELSGQRTSNFITGAIFDRDSWESAGCDVSCDCSPGNDRSCRRCESHDSNRERTRGGRSALHRRNARRWRPGTYMEPVGLPS